MICIINKSVMRKKIGKLDVAPSKMTFLSIIADYDLNRSICELVDNVLDLWVKSAFRLREGYDRIYR